jgi:hypothetical protein
MLTFFFFRLFLLSLLLFQKMYDLGFRDFIVSNMPPLGCLPIILCRSTQYASVCTRTNASGAANNPAQTDNKKLEKELGTLRTQLTGSNIILVDFSATFSQAVSDSGTVLYRLQDTFAGLVL